MLVKGLKHHHSKISQQNFHLSEERVEKGTMKFDPIILLLHQPAQYKSFHYLVNSGLRLDLVVLKSGPESKTTRSSLVHGRVVSVNYRK